MFCTVIIPGDRALGFESERLTIPHPLMHLRDFVLMPLAEIAPDTVHPTLNNSIAGLLAEIRK